MKQQNTKECVSTRCSGLGNNKERTVYSGLLKRHYVIIVCIINIFLQLADLQFKIAILAQNTHKQVIGCAVVCRNKQMKVTFKRDMLSIHQTRREQSEAKTISIVVLALQSTGRTESGRRQSWLKLC